MENYYAVLQGCPLFKGIAIPEIEPLLGCLSARRKRFSKGSFIFREGEAARLFGVVLSGAVHVMREDFWGKRKILARAESGGLFGEAFACARVDKLPVSAVAAEDAEILFISCERIMVFCSSACSFHSGIIKNLAYILAGRNVAFTRKLQHITQATTREKLLSYLSEQAGLKGGGAFTIPFNREELADYLSVERSAMSAELSKMRKDGLLLYKKNSFELLREAACALKE